MKIAVFSDVHDNLTRWAEAAEIIKAKGIKVGICCGDVTSLETLEEIAKSFETLYLAAGNGDYRISRAVEQIPDNVKYFEKVGAFELEGKKIAIVHNSKLTPQIADSSIYVIIFYGHTHTPWEKKIKKSIILNPGEVAGHYGQASFCIFDLEKLKGQLKLLK